MPQAPGPGRRGVGRPLVIALVLLAHGLLLLGALRLGVWRDRRPPERPRPPLQLMLLRPPPLPRADAAAPDVPRRPARREPQPISVAPPAPAPERTADGPTAITAPDAAPSAEPPASAPPRLDLRLPPRAPGVAGRNPALDDPRANSARPWTVESRIAAALGGVDGIVEERLDDGRMRFRRGSSCVVVHPNRAERIDPFNASAYPKMKGVEGC